MRDDSAARLEIYFRQYRGIARAIVLEELLTRHPALRLSDIGPGALQQASEWHDRRVRWSWDRLLRRARKRPRRIELAIWDHSKLCGLALGRVSDGKVVARLDWLERDPHAVHLVRFIAAIATRYIETMGALTGCDQAVLWRPAPDLLDFYINLGYTSLIRRGGAVLGLRKRLTTAQTATED
jgi:hypothetical protein